MLEDHEITRDELYAVGATFTLVAWAFAYAYTVCQAIEPGSFTAAVDPSGERSWMELLFLSFTTLTSTGLSDVVPVKPFARSLSMIEQLAGLAYVAMVVSRLVALTVLHPRAATSGPSRTRSHRPAMASPLRSPASRKRRAQRPRQACGVRPGEPQRGHHGRDWRARPAAAAAPSPARPRPACELTAGVEKFAEADALADHRARAVP